MLQIFLFIYSYLADLPSHCLQKQIFGKWTFYLSDYITSENEDQYKCGWKEPYNQNNFVKVDQYKLEISKQLSLQLNTDFSVTDNTKYEIFSHNFNNTWTNIYDEGFEVNYNDYSFFSFFNFEKRNFNTTIMTYNTYSKCNETLIGWYSYQNKKRGCFYATQQTKIYNDVNSQIIYNKDFDIMLAQVSLKITKNDISNEKQVGSSMKNLQNGQTDTKKQQKDDVNLYVDKLNQKNIHWKAKIYENFNNKNLAQIYSSVYQNRKPYYFQSSFSKQNKNIINFAKLNISLPISFNWQDVIPDAIQQGQCGSCYIISTLQMLQARIKIKYNQDIQLSQGYINDCNYYSQGCDGGYAYEIFRYIKENYAVSHQCKEHRTKKCEHFCSKEQLYQQYLVTIEEYGYLGKIYNNVSENQIMWEVYKNGPVVVNMQSSIEFGFYTSGIYTKKQKKDKKDDDSFTIVNHSVLLYGWGEEDGFKYWNVQNSWGKDWGEQGRFRIERGNNILGIESMVEIAQPKIQQFNEDLIQKKVKENSNILKLIDSQLIQKNIFKTLQIFVFQIQIINVKKDQKNIITLKLNYQFLFYYGCFFSFFFLSFLIFSKPFLSNNISRFYQGQLILSSIKFLIILNPSEFYRSFLFFFSTFFTSQIDFFESISQLCFFFEHIFLLSCSSLKSS